MTLWIIIGLLLAVSAAELLFVFVNDDEADQQHRAEAELLMHTVQTDLRATQAKAEIRATAARMRQQLDRELCELDEEHPDFRSIDEYLRGER